MEKVNVSELLNRFGNKPLELLRALGGYYECPKDTNGKRTGPLVAYAATYPDESGAMRNFVGDIYANFAILEQYPMLLHRMARILHLTTKRFSWKQTYLQVHRLGVFQ